MTRDEAVKLVQRVVAEAAMLADGTTAGVGELEEAREALIAALTAPAAGEDVELVHALEEAVKSDLLGGTTARPALTQTARVG
jgi:hypothetical protein